MRSHDWRQLKVTKNKSQTEEGEAWSGLCSSVVSSVFVLQLWHWSPALRWKSTWGRFSPTLFPSSPPSSARTSEPWSCARWLLWTSCSETTGNDTPVNYTQTSVGSIFFSPVSPWMCFCSSSAVTPVMVDAVLAELPPLISESDMHVSQMALSFLSTLAVTHPSSLGQLSGGNIMQQLIALVRSPLLQGGALAAMLDFNQVLELLSFCSWLDADIHKSISWGFSGVITGKRSQLWLQEYQQIVFL